MLQNDYVLLLDELRLKLLDVKPQIDDLADAIGLNPLKEELSQLEGQTAQEGFWNDLAGTQKILQRISRIKDEISSYQKLASAYEDVMTLVELGMDSPEESEATFEEAKLEYNALMDELETKKLATLLKGEYDGNNAILAFHAGPAAWRPRTGPRCSTGCTPAGRSATATNARCWITSAARKAGSKAPPSSLRGKTPTDF